MGSANERVGECQREAESANERQVVSSFGNLARISLNVTDLLILVSLVTFSFEPYITGLISTGV